MTSQAERYQEIVNRASEKDEAKQALVSFNLQEGQLDNIASSSKFYITDEDRSFLQEYQDQLEMIQPWARKIRSEEKNKTKQRVIRRINEEIEDLEEEISRALEEDKTLEQIAATLRDRRLTEEAERIKAGLEQPHARIERLVEKKNQTKEFMEKFENIRRHIGEENSIENALEKRLSAVNLILENAQRVDDKKIRLELPAWEQNNFEDDAIYVEPEQSNDLDLMLELAKDMVKLAADQGVIDPDMSKSVSALHAHIDYARRQDGHRSTSSAEYDVLNHQSNARIRVWINPGVTLFKETRDLPVSSDRLILIDSRLFDDSAALLATLIHELMHAYFEHKGNPSHKKIHVMAEAVLKTCLESDISENELELESIMLESIIDSKPISRKEVNKAYLYALASEGLFPG